tara:strand:- start:900 stop:1181 length:282 start_codon:yes stop_codon:yes gene_type:complete
MPTHASGWGQTQTQKISLKPSDPVSHVRPLDGEFLLLLLPLRHLSRMEIMWSRAEVVRAGQGICSSFACSNKSRAGHHAVIRVFMRVQILALL